MSKLNQKKFQSFRPAQLHEGKEWVITYYVKNPYSDKEGLERVRIKCNRIKPIKERRKYARRLIHEINSELYNGWNPFLESEAPKSYNKLMDVLDIYLKSRIREKLSPDTIRTYRSKIVSLKAWLVEKGKEDVYMMNFKKADALAYMNYLYNEKGFKNITYNKTLKWCRTLFNWCIENQYINENHFNLFKVKKEEQKERKVIPAAERDRLKKYFEENNSDFFLVCLLVFGSLIRPKEITFLKKSFFDLDKQIIKLPGYATKNGKGRIATIPDSNIEYFKSYFNTTELSDAHFLFDAKCRPSLKQINAKDYSRLWTKVRKDLNYPMEYKLYSLRDSGIIQLLQDGVSPEDVMRLADHSSLETTSIYVRHANPVASEQVKSKSRGF